MAGKDWEGSRWGGFCPEKALVGWTGRDLVRVGCTRMWFVVCYDLVKKGLTGIRWRVCLGVC